MMSVDYGLIAKLRKTDMLWPGAPRATLGWGDDGSRWAMGKVGNPMKSHSSWEHPRTKWWMFQQTTFDYWRGRPWSVIYRGTLNHPELDQYMISIKACGALAIPHDLGNPHVWRKYERLRNMMKYEEYEWLIPGFWGIASSPAALGLPPHPSGWKHLRRAGVVKFWSRSSWGTHHKL